MACSPLQGHEFAALPERDRSAHSAYAANFVAETAAAAAAVAARLARDGVHDVGAALRVCKRLVRARPRALVLPRAPPRRLCAAPQARVLGAEGAALRDLLCARRRARALPPLRPPSPSSARVASCAWSCRWRRCRQFLRRCCPRR
jgi:hypothetical protein